MQLAQCRFPGLAINSQFPMLKHYYRPIFQIKQAYMEAIVSDSSRKLMIWDYQNSDCSLRKKTFLLSFIIIFNTLSYPMHNLQSRPTKPRQGQVTTMETSNHFSGGSNEAAEGGQLPRAQRARGRKTAYFWLTNTKASIMCPQRRAHFVVSAPGAELRRQWIGSDEEIRGGSREFSSKTCKQARIFVTT